MEAATMSLTKDSVPGNTIPEIREQLEQLLQFVDKAAQDAADLYDVERRVFGEVLELGYKCVEVFIGLQGTGDLGEEVVTHDDRTLYRSSSPHSRSLRTVFGEHEFEQFVYSPGANRKIELKPLDARMGLSGHVPSYLMEEFSQMFCVESAFALSAKNLTQVFGGTFSVNTLELTSRRMGAQAEQFLDNIPKPDPKEEGEFLIGSADGKGVPMIRKDTKQKPAMDDSKERPGNRKMATVSAVYSVDPYVRSPADVIAALFRDDLANKDYQRPKPQFKLVTAHFPEVYEDAHEAIEFTGTNEAFAWMQGEVDKRRKPKQTFITLLDGDPKLWNNLAAFLPGDTIGILDIIHVTQYVWKAAKVFCKSPEDIEAFARVRILWILQGRARSVIRGLKHMSTARKLRGKPKETIATVCGYFSKHLDHMRYDEYLREGYPIASGVIEGACGHLVKDRMERSGMRWRLSGAKAMLNVRAIHQSDYCTEFHTHRRQTERAKLHPLRELLDEYHPAQLAL
jgi:hypothetical protein